MYQDVIKGQLRNDKPMVKRKSTDTINKYCTHNQKRVS